ncbi:ABC transporter ATP-binding protein/permease [Crassaminicella profunda]|uniref:ABC transporter ATP-binding protein/permease n=1 Tax=Crassaminicella profunda TaxID=1286698 RepID=UPI001CA67129|nr:ABC transporter ATP-binding protein/permease [Crassaminicella profunda]QZY55878.1 ABC transporter ATP-binding protein/permease [Crassaminicella profunda]
MINKRLIGLVPACKKWILLTVFIQWIGLLANIVGIFFIGNYIEYTYNHGVDATKSLVTLAVCIGVMGVRFISNYWAVKTSSLCSQDARKNIRNTIYQKLLDLDIHYNKTTSTSEVVQVTIDGVERLEIYFGKYLPQFFYCLLAPLTLFIVLSFIHFKSALILFLCVPLIPISIVFVMKIAKRLLADYWKTYVNLGDTFLENLRGLVTLKIYDQDEERNEKMNVEAERFRKITMKVLAMQLNSINVMDLIAFGGSAIGIILSLKAFSLGEISIAGALMILLLSSEIFIPLRLLGSFFHVTMDGMAAAEKIFRIIDTPIKEQKIKEVKDFNKIDIAFEKVNFFYERTRKILEDVDLNIKMGETTALVGPSGCGKSTIANILMGFYKDYEGKILLKGKELREIDPFTLRKKLNIVTSNSYIFTGTFEENLKMGKYDATEEEMMEVLKKVNLYDYVLSLKNGLQEEIKEGGSNLSGGQRQKLALARALLYDSEIYIFDEATSSVDVESEDDIMKVIYQLGKTKTVLIISHRLYNIKNADQIYVLSKGKIQEKGNHKELMNQFGLYARMVKEQNELERLGGRDCA